MVENRVIIIPDLHWRDTDIKTIGGYCEATDLVAQDLVTIMKEEKITHGISTGDWCDKGYRQLHATFSHRNYLQEMNDLTNRNMFMCIGNHFFLERDSNPEIYWIQPNDKFKPVKPIYAVEPLLKTPDQIMIGCMQFSLFHYKKEQEGKMYFRPKMPNAKYHGGVYHDDMVVPAHVRVNEGIHVNVNSGYTRNVYSNIDLAVIGHIHTPIGEVVMQVDGRNIPVDIPGSLAIVSSKPSDMHTHVNIPVFTITDNTVKKEYIKVSLHTDKLKFFKQKEQPMLDNKFMPSDLSPIEKMTELMRRSSAGYITPESFLELGGASEAQKKLYTAAAQGRLNISTAVKILVGKE